MRLWPSVTDAIGWSFLLAAVVVPTPFVSSALPISASCDTAVVVLFDARRCRFGATCTARGTVADAGAGASVAAGGLGGAAAIGTTPVLAEAVEAENGAVEAF